MARKKKLQTEEELPAAVVMDEQLLLEENPELKEAGVEVGSPIELVEPPEELPNGVFRKQEVDINGRKYNKFWRIDGTEYVELIG